MQIFLKDHLKARKKSVKRGAIVIEPTIEPRFSYPPMSGIGFIRKEAVKSVGKILKEENDRTMITANDLIFIRPENGHRYLPYIILVIDMTVF